MILIADSGSTKTDWCVVDNGQIVRRVMSKGMNPYFHSEEDVCNEIAGRVLPELGMNSFGHLYFYGAGCNREKSPLVRGLLAKHFPVTGDIEVDTDMLAAARGMCGSAPGIVCILGTGSNSCYYDGERITANVSPLGYILGDEGSGAVLGKLLVGDILKNQTRPELKKKFLEQYNLTQAEIIERVYRGQFPNRFLAGLSPFLAQNIHEPELRELTLNSFIAFFTRNVKQYDYENNDIHLIGSIACHYEEVLREAAGKTGFRIGKISKSPMEGLAHYHSNNK